MARVRFAATDPSTVPTPPANKSTMFLDINDLSYKAKLPDGSIIPISVTEEYLQDIIGNTFQDSSTIDFTYDDAGNIATIEVINAGLDISEIPNVPSGNLSATNVQDALNELQSSIDDSDQALADHLADPTDAHDASAISYVNTASGLSANDAQSAIDEVDQNLDDHLNGGPNKHDATEIDYERDDLDRNDIQAGSDEVESALSDLDDNKLSRSGNQPMTGDLNMDGNNIVTGAGLVDGRDVSVDGAKLDTVEFNAKDDQIASEVPYTPTGNLLTSTELQASTDEIEGIIVEPQTVVVKKSAGTGQFDSVKDAIDSITDASPTKPYIIEVRPGIYLEDPIVMKPNVSICGCGKTSTIIVANDPNSDLITMSGANEVTGVGLDGTTNAALVRFVSTNATDINVTMRNIGFLTCLSAIYLEANSFDANLDVSDSTFTNGQIADNFIDIRGFGAGQATLNASSLRGSLFNNSVHFFDIRGPNATLSASNVVMRSNGTSHFIHAEDGCTVNLQTITARDFEIGIHCPNVGTGPVLDTNGVLRNSPFDIQIENPNTTGYFSGAADNDKVSVNVLAEFRASFTDPVNGGDIGQVVVGEIRQGDRHDRIANITKLLRQGTTLGLLSGGDLTENPTPFDLDVAAGNGFLNDSNDTVLEINWNTTTLTVPPDTSRYVTVNENATVQLEASLPTNLEDRIVLGRVATSENNIILIESASVSGVHQGNTIESYLRKTLGPLFVSGGLFTENAGTPRQLDVTASEYFFGSSRFTPPAVTGLIYNRVYRDGLGGYTSDVGETLLPNDLFDDGSGGLVSVPAGEFVKHQVFIIPQESGGFDYDILMGQETFATVGDAIDADNPPLPPQIFDASVAMANVICQEGNANIVEIIDVRPRIGFASASIGTVSDHGSLLGLNEDDHPQYMLANGSRTMTGNLDMGGNSVSNVDTVNGVTVEAHADRHLPNGSDPLDTNTAVELTDNTNAEGNANSFARSNHTHAHGNRGGGTLHAEVTPSVAGFMSAADKTKLDTIETNAKDDQDADEVPYNNTSSGLSATDVQGAVDEIDQNLDNHIADPTNAHDASAIGYDNTSSGLSATEAQAAIDEVEGRVDTAESTLSSHLNGGASKHDATEIDYERANIDRTSIDAASNDVETALSDLDDNKLARDGSQAMTGSLDMGGNDVTNVNNIDGRDVSVDGAKLDTIETNAKDDQDAFEVPYDNSSSGLSATDVQAAIDENDSRLDSIEGQTYVNSFNGRTGAVTPTSGDYNAGQITNTPSGNIAALNVQAAINELDAEKQPLDADLTGLAGLSDTGFISRTGTGTFANREILTAAGELTVSNGDGVSGDPQLGLANAGAGAGTVGAANSSLTITTDIKGRVTARAAQLINIVSSQVSNFAATVRSTLLTGYSVGSNVALAATDTVLQAFQKVQGQINARIQGPASATDNAIARYDGTTGKLAQNSNATVDDNGGIVAGNLVRPGDTADTTNGNIRFNGGDLQGRVGAQWRSLVDVDSYEATASNVVSTASGSYVTVPGMTITAPPEGTYLVFFNFEILLQGVNDFGSYAIFVDTTEQTDSTRELETAQVNDVWLNAGTHAIVTVNGSQDIAVGWLTPDTTLEARRRTLIAIRIS